MSKRTLLLRVLALAAAVTAAYFAIHALVDNWVDARAALLSADPLTLLAAVAVAAVGTAVIGAAWGSILTHLEPQPHRYPALAWYFVGEVAKYVPGSAWSVIGRGELAQRGGVPRPTAYLSVLGSLILLYGTAAGIGAITVLTPEITGGTVRLVIMTLLVISIIPLTHPRVVGPVTSTAARWAKAPTPPPEPDHQASLTLVGIYASAWALIGTATWLVVRSLGMNGSWYDITCATIVAWLAGFVVVFAPGGIGIREAAFIALSGLDSGDAALVAVVARLVFVTVDVGGAALATVWLRLRRHRVDGAVRRQSTGSSVGEP